MATHIPILLLASSLPPNCSLSFQDLDLFIRMTACFRYEIALYGSQGHIPLVLPPHVSDLIATVLTTGNDPHSIRALWMLVKDTVWGLPADFVPYFSAGERTAIDTAGSHIQNPHQQLATSMLYPPVVDCTVCHRRLKKPSRINVSLYRSSEGLCTRAASYSTSLRCENCMIRYYPTYYSQGGMRLFYTSTPPAVIQIEDHAYIERALCELFTMMMVHAHVSHQNCAAIFNSVSKTYGDTELTSTQVSRAFVLHALLRDTVDLGQLLSIPDSGTNDDRLYTVITARNEIYRQNGQPEKMHACTTCVHFEEDSDQFLRAIVTDGITLGRPCCKVHECPNPLPSNRDHFCAIHASLNAQCVVTACLRASTPGFQTCDDPSHRKFETERNERGKSFFQLRSRLQRSGNIPVAEGEDILLMDDDDSDESDAEKGEAGNRPPKARFSRRRTHNEQLAVSCCGVVLGRQTMYGSEAVSNVSTFLKSLWPDREDLPNVIFYDNNCRLQGHLHAQGDNYFEDVIMPVDVFHFKSKHKVTDKFCQRHCNPSLWPELLADRVEGKWRFNSSAAEQTNAWMGGYLPIVRDMVAHRYEFFLDEMIKRRNELIICRLEMAGKAPYQIPSARAMST